MLTEHQIKLTEHLKTARNKEYFKYYEMVFDDLSQPIKLDAANIIQDRQRFTCIDIAALAIKYNLAFKPCCEFLEKLEVLPQGTYSKIQRRKNFKVADAFAAAKERYFLAES